MNVQHAIKGQLSNHLELNERFHQLEQVVEDLSIVLSVLILVIPWVKLQLLRVSCLTKAGA